MKLQNDFSRETRLLYLYEPRCFICGCNGNERGGLEIHHILGRCSSSPFNSSCLCGYCHKNICHNRAEHQRIFAETIYFLKKQGYKPTEEDFEFLKENYEELIGGNEDLILKLL